LPGLLRSADGALRQIPLNPPFPKGDFSRSSRSQAPAWERKWHRSSASMTQSWSFSSDCIPTLELGNEKYKTPLQAGSLLIGFIYMLLGPDTVPPADGSWSEPQFLFHFYHVGTDLLCAIHAENLFRNQLRLRQRTVAYGLFHSGNVGGGETETAHS